MIFDMKGVVMVAVVAVAALGTLSCTSNVAWRTSSGAVWGTTYRITYQADVDLTDSILAETEAVDRSLSMFRDSSTVSRINAGTSVIVDSLFRTVFELSQRVSAASGGRFDPTVAPLVDMWGFGRRVDSGNEVPDSAAVAEALKGVGIDRCRIVGDSIVKAHPTTEFDFSAIAKGYGVDRVAAMLRRCGCVNFMVEIGGEISLSGHNPRGALWRIQVDAPVRDAGAPGDSALTVLELTDCAVATSGNYRNYRRVGVDSVVGHTINPLTGFPAPEGWLSATVIAPECALADALATALMASPPENAARLMGRFASTKALLVGLDGAVVEIIDGRVVAGAFEP